MHIVVVGSGYVGLVTGACFASMGNNVVCVDIDEQKIASLRSGVLPIYEPGLDDLVRQNVEAGFLSFSTSLAEALPGAEFAFIAVGTPQDPEGRADLQYVFAVAADIGRHMDDYLVVVDKSTVPVGTAERVRAIIQDELQARGVVLEFDVVSNPEFLKEGAAIQDFNRPDRIVIGTDSERASERLHQLYAPFVRNRDRVLLMGVRDAEMTKYAANAMLATKISFMNEIAQLCDRLGVDVEQVRKGIGSDSRIGYAFIYPGAGYGGSCFPKDVKTVIQMARDADIEPVVLAAVENRNSRQKRVLFEKISAHFGGRLAGRRFGVWGLAFKPGTDDMREASSVVLINALLAAGATVAAYDPVAFNTARREFDEHWFSDGRLVFETYQYEVPKKADALVVVTEWKRFRQPDFDAIKELMLQPVLFDGRNLYEPELLAEHGFTYYAIGRGAGPALHSEVAIPKAGRSGG